MRKKTYLKAKNVQNFRHASLRDSMFKLILHAEVKA